MPALANALTSLVSLAILVMPAQVAAQQENSQSNPVMASGTLNLVLANKNGFVVAADSRMSSDHPFLCEGKRQLYCDNSQKLFRTTPNSAMVIAGFAVGQFKSPLDLAVASVIRKELVARDWPNDDQAASVPAAAENLLVDALTGVAAMFDSATTPGRNLFMWTTFARFGTDRLPVVEQKVFVAEWKPTGPQNVLVPVYTVRSATQKVTGFFALPVGITCVADAVLDGHYRTTNPVIQSYYHIRTNQALLDNMPVDKMLSLAKAILSETRKYTDLVGGEDQLGVFPASGHVQWSLPANLPSEAQLQPRVYRFSGLTCSNTNTPPCGFAPASFFFSPQQKPDEVFKKYFLASEFIQIPVALDNNVFVGNTFDHVTLRWLGGSFFMLRNAYNDCVLQLPEGVELPHDPELVARCSIERKPTIDIYTIVGARPQMMVGSCVKWNSDHTCAQVSSLGLPPMQP